MSQRGHRYSPRRICRTLRTSLKSNVEIDLWTVIFLIFWGRCCLFLFWGHTWQRSGGLENHMGDWDLNHSPCLQGKWATTVLTVQPPIFLIFFIFTLTVRVSVKTTLCGMVKFKFFWESSLTPQNKETGALLDFLSLFFIFFDIFWGSHLVTFRDYT